MLPQLFLDRMKMMLGGEYEEFLSALEQEKYQSLRLNGLKDGAGGKNAAEAVKTGELPFHLTAVPWAENGYYYEKTDQPGKHPYHQAGLYYIQEPSAMAPVSLLSVEPGQKVLDLCAAPGGKSTQIAALLKGEGLLVSNEIHPARAKILSENMERMGVRNACVTNESPQALAEVFPGYFDRILVDAPCSGEGMFRKNEEACAEWSPENVELCAGRQDEILDCAARMLRPGGRLVYSTCTFAPQENEGSISRFIKRNPDFSILPIDKSNFKASYGRGSSESFCDGRPEWIPEPVPHLEDTLRLWPHHIKGEGHYAALLQKAGQPGDYGVMAATGLEKAASAKELGEWPEFQKQSLTTPLSGKYIRFGEHIYLAPEELPGLKGLKVLRPGLQLGTLKKNRFEPSHGLALAISPKEAVRVWNLNSQESEAGAYLGGQTFPAEGEKGWYLICVDGYSTGWGKLAGGIMKNHYPKGLRKI